MLKRAKIISKCITCSFVILLIVLLGCQSDSENESTTSIPSSTAPQGLVAFETLTESHSKALCVMDIANREVRHLSELQKPLAGSGPLAWAWGSRTLATPMLDSRGSTSLLDVEDGITSALFPLPGSDTTWSHRPQLSQGYEAIDKELSFATRQRSLLVFRQLVVLGQVPTEFNSMRQVTQSLDSLNTVPSPFGGNPPLHHIGLLCRLDSLGGDTILQKTIAMDFTQGLSVIPDGRTAAISDGTGIIIIDLPSGVTTMPVKPASYRLFSPRFSPDGNALAAVGWKSSGANEGAILLIARAPTFSGFTTLLDVTGKIAPQWITWSPDGKWLLMSCFVYGRGNGPWDSDLALLELSTLKWRIIERPYKMEGKSLPDLVAAFPSGGLDWCE